MKTSLGRTLFALALLSALVTPASAARALQRQDAPPDRAQVVTVKYDGDVPPLLRHLASEYGVTIGLETLPREPRPKVNIFLRNVTLRDILSAVADAHPEYRLRDGGDSFDLYPAGGRSPLLDAQVASFELKEAHWAEGCDALFALPEVAAVAVAEGLARRDSGSEQSGGPGAKFSLMLKGVTVREALHEMARRGGDRFWVYRETARGAEKTFTVSH